VVAPPGPNEKVTAIDQQIAAGGPAANAAIACAALGGTARLVTDLGTHPLAAAAAADLVANGVEVRAVDPAGERMPALSSIHVTDATGDRSVVSVNASTAVLQAPDWLPSVIRDATIVLLDGHHPALAVAAAQAARARHIPVMLDAGSWKPVSDSLLPLVDIAICSAVFRIPGVAADPTSIAVDLLRRGPSWVAISHGPDPVRWWDGADPTGETTGSVAIDPVTVRDTLGAGDVLHGAFAFHRARGASNVAALRDAVRVATDKCTHVGPAAWRDAIRAAARTKRQQ
jgi:sugar/nucleoside kinase (ribokinase family)